MASVIISPLFTLYEKFFIPSVLSSTLQVTSTLGFTVKMHFITDKEQFGIFARLLAVIFNALGFAGDE